MARMKDTLIAEQDAAITQEHIQALFEKIHFDGFIELDTITIVEPAEDGVGYVVYEEQDGQAHIQNLTHEQFIARLEAATV